MERSDYSLNNHDPMLFLDIRPYGHIRADAQHICWAIKPSVFLKALCGRVVLIQPKDEAKVRQTGERRGENRAMKWMISNIDSEAVCF